MTYHCYPLQLSWQYAMTWEFFARDSLLCQLLHVWNQFDGRSSMHGLRRMILCRSLLTLPLLINNIIFSGILYSHIKVLWCHQVDCKQSSSVWGGKILFVEQISSFNFWFCGLIRMGYKPPLYMPLGDVNLSSFCS